MPKTPEEIAADEKAASDAQREQLAREANKKRNDAMLEARNAIADNADDIKTDEDDLVPLTDEVWDQNDRPEDAKRKTRAERLADQEAEEEEAELTEEEAAARLIRAKEAEDRELDDARDAGADDSRQRKDGTVEYRLVVNGKEKWLTLRQLRESAGKVDAADEYLQDAKEGATNGPTRRTSPTDAEREQARREAEERRKEERATLRAKLVDLNTRASMGDDAAINELADMQLEAIQGDSGRLMRMVDERVDSRIVGRTDFQKAVDWFEDEYSDVLTTPRLKTEAGRLDVELANANPDLSPRDRLDKVGKQMRQLREDLGGAPRRKDTPRAESKLERKKNAPQIPTAAGRQRPDAEPDEQESTQDAIRKMAQSRGQARAISHKH
jgi:hypothetical protein